MNKTLSVGILSALLSSSVMVSFAANKPAVHPVKPPPPDYFPLGKDYWWKYQTTASTGDSGFELKVVNVEKQPDDTYVFQLHTQPQNAVGPGAAGFDEWYKKQSGYVETLKFSFAGQISDYTPARKILIHPTKVGDTWIWSGTRTANLQTTENNKVDALEDIEVPAGRFKAMRVTSDVVQGGAAMTKTYWYAPWVGLVQSKTQSGTVTSTTQLVKYVFPRPDKEKTLNEK